MKSFNDLLEIHEWLDDLSLGHHDSRERKVLYPSLDEVTSEREREAMFASLKCAPAMAAHA